MNQEINKQLPGLMDSISHFARVLYSMEFSPATEDSAREKIITQIRQTGIDEVLEDDVGNIIAVHRGNKTDRNIVLLSSIESTSAFNDMYKEFTGTGTNSHEIMGTKAGIISSIFSVALLKQSMRQVPNNLIICCIPKKDSAVVNIHYLFDNFLKNIPIDLAIICEPTDCNIFIGNRGKFEYEITIDIEDMGKQYIRGLRSLKPLITQFQRISETLPWDNELGKSSITIKKRLCNHSLTDNHSTLHLTVERTYLPEEDPERILKRAREIAESIYCVDRYNTINISPVKKSVVTKSGSPLLVEDELKPWKMQLTNPFVHSSLETLNENGIASSIGYWKNRITCGSYIFGEHKVPTIGFGAGTEYYSNPTRNKPPYFNDLLKAIYGTALILDRTRE